MQQAHYDVKGKTAVLIPCPYQVKLNNMLMYKLVIFSAWNMNVIVAPSFAEHWGAGTASKSVLKERVQAALQIDFGWKC